MMSEKVLETIREHMSHPTLMWNILVAQRSLELLMTEVEHLRARVSTCKFCGQEIAEGAGGHTSGCYERMLNEQKELVARLMAAIETPGDLLEHEVNHLLEDAHEWLQPEPREG